ncbi:MOSC domain-containing protein [Ochrobactrum tritici]|uniref:MOSC domain-containing protein n=1 Tax=Brucella tritici TaxID=94626 RepID=A0A7X6JDT0_9HYPH|nr:MOSC domain-containing protein [Brucella tritici]
MHLVTVASLEEISRKANLDGLEAERYRPNIVIDSSDTNPFIENSWSGQKLQIGSAVLEIMVPTPRCAVPTLAHGLGLEPKPDVLRAIHAQNRVDIPDVGAFPCLGVYAKVLHSGTQRREIQCSSLSPSAPFPWSAANVCQIQKWS